MTVDPLITQFNEFLAALAHAPDVEFEAAAIASPAVHFALYCQIRDQDNNLIRDPMPNILQLRMCEAFETIRAMGIKVRIIVTKPRRAGCSSFVEHIGYHTAMQRPINGMTIADDKAGSQAAMAKLASYATTDSFKWGVRILSSPAHSISWSNGSTWIVDTAENADAGAGDTLNFFHGTEVSKWPKTSVKNDAKVMSCVAPALSGRNTVMFCESTPEGAEGWQFETWQTAVWLHELIEMREKGICPEEIWVKVFAAWFEFPENRRVEKVSDAEIEEINLTLTDIEAFEIEKYGLDWEQVAWRRDTIAAKCNKDPKVFSYYYPSDPVSCWLTSGSPRFDMSTLVKWEDLARNITPEAGFLVKQDRGNVTWHPSMDGTGDIYIWERPLPGLRYIVTFDPAESKSQTIGTNTDAHSISVWRAAYHDTLTNRWKRAKLVARVAPPFRAEEDEAAKHVIRLSIYYGRALIAQETNKGFHALRVLQEAGMPLYKRKPISHRTGKVEEQYGFKTDSNNREAIISGLASAIANDNLEIHCMHTLGEMKSFIRNSKGRSEAGSKAHDDDVMAAAIAHEVLPSATEYMRHEARNEDPPDDQSWKNATWQW